MLKLNPDAIGIRDEQLRRFAALRYLVSRIDARKMAHTSAL